MPTALKGTWATRLRILVSRPSEHRGAVYLQGPRSQHQLHRHRDRQGLPHHDDRSHADGRMSGADSPRRSAAGRKGRGGRPLSREEPWRSPRCAGQFRLRLPHGRTRHCDRERPATMRERSVRDFVRPLRCWGWTHRRPIRFQNEGRPCRLRGYPGIDGLSADGRVVVRAKRLLHGYLGGRAKSRPSLWAVVNLPQRFSRGPTSPFTASLVIHIAIFASHRPMRRAASGSTSLLVLLPRDSSRRFRQDRDAQIGRQLWAKTARGGEAPAASELPLLCRARKHRGVARHPASARKAGAPA